MKTMNTQTFGQTRGRKRHAGFAILAAAALALVVPIQAHHTEAHDGPDGIGNAGSGSPNDPFTLRKGQSVFWDGPTFVGGDQVPTIGFDVVLGPIHDNEPRFPCDLAPDACFDYHLTLLDAGPSLRIAADSPTSSRFGIEVYGPDGSLLASSSHFYSVEVFVEDAVAGEHLVRLVAHDVRGNPPQFGGSDEIAVRMRAQLEADEKGPTKLQALEPNLQVKLRDLRLGECDEEESGMGTVPGTTCLRFETGTENVGEGPFEVRFATADDVNLTEETQPAYQRIHYSDGSFIERRAGFHDTLIHPQHTHYHLTAAIAHELDRVTDAKRGLLEPLSSENKIGWCSAEYRMSNWDRFYQGRPDATLILDGEGSNCGVDPSQPRAVLTQGWTDIYWAGLTGQQVPFDHGDGQYVVRSRFDPDHHMLETDEDDNEGYIWFTLTGPSIEVHEAGYGHSPWDPHKAGLDPYWW